MHIYVLMNKSVSGNMNSHVRFFPVFNNSINISGWKDNTIFQDWLVGYSRDRCNNITSNKKLLKI